VAKIDRHYQFEEHLAFGDKSLFRSNDPRDQENTIVRDWRTFVPESHAFSSGAQNLDFQPKGLVFTLIFAAPRSSRGGQIIVRAPHANPYDYATYTLRMK
jgi:hypothetical protein